MAAKLLLAAASASLLYGQQSLPLFVIERSLNANVVHYEAKVTPDGKLDPRQPVVAYWVMAAEDGRRQELNLLERIKAYGFSAQIDPAGDSCRIVLVAEKRREIHVYRQGGAMRAETLIDGHRAYIQKIFVGTHRSFKIQTPEYVELYGADTATGEQCHERLLPR